MTNKLIYDIKGKGRELGEFIGKGGQGEVFALKEESSILVKLFHDGRDRAALEKKVRLQITEKTLIQNSRLAWPQISIHDSSGQWLGYAMRRGQGKSLSRLAHPKLYLKHYPGLDRQNIVQMLLQLVKIIEILHQEKVCLGDINLDNVLYDATSRELTLIDNDSFQLDRKQGLFCCPVGKLEMTPIEHLDLDFRKVRRTVQSDLFSLAILMFQCLMLGRHPYDSIGGGNPVENLLAGNFPYGMGGARPGSQGAIPSGPWYAIWSHLTYHVKTLFIRTFNEGARDPSQRASLAEWSEVLEKYAHALRAGHNNAAIRPQQPKSSKE